MITRYSTVHTCNLIRTYMLDCSIRASYSLIEARERRVVLCDAIRMWPVSAIIRIFWIYSHTWLAFIVTNSAERQQATENEYRRQRRHFCAIIVDKRVHSTHERNMNFVFVCVESSPSGQWLDTEHHEWKMWLTRNWHRHISPKC